jgi:hypothetical protein
LGRPPREGFGRCEPTSGIEPFSRLVDDVMTHQPYATARRVYWVVDNGSSHRGKAAADRLRAAYPNARVIHLPVHASWLNQIEIYFSVVQRKVLTPNDFTDLAEVEARLLQVGVDEDHTDPRPRSMSWSIWATSPPGNECRTVAWTAASLRAGSPAGARAVTSRKAWRTTADTVVPRRRATARNSSSSVSPMTTCNRVLIGTA